MYRLIIADDERIVLNGIKNTIDWESLGIQVVAWAQDGEEFYRKAVEYTPDIALVDIRMPGMDGLTAIGKLRPLLENCQFIIFTAYEDFAYAKRALELCILRSRADSDAFQSGRYAEHNGRPKTLKKVA